MDDKVILEISGVVFELRELGDFMAEIAIFPDGHYDVISSEELSLIPSIVYSRIHQKEDSYSLPEDMIEYYYNKLFKFLPVIDRISCNVSKIEPPKEKEIKLIPITSLLI